MKTITQYIWTSWEKFFFRLFFIYFFLLIIPLKGSFYTQWFTQNWAEMHIRDIPRFAGNGLSFFKVVSSHQQVNDHREKQKGNIAKKDPLVIKGEDAPFNVVSYINHFILLGLGIVGSLIWGLFDRNRVNYRVLLYFSSVMVSFALAIHLQGLTFSKIFPTQMPDLALTQLNTPFGDFTAQKLYWIQFSFVHGYEIFAGLAELAIMLFLFFRQTRALGAALSVAMIGNITYANHAYDGGIHLAAFFFTIGGAYVLWPYFTRVYKLLVKEENTQDDLYYYPFSKPWEKVLRYGVKTALLLFFFLYSGYLHWYNYKYDSYKVPSNPGLVNARGVYEVEDFILSGDTINYDPMDSIRWRTVTLEDWSTLSYTVNNTFMVHGEAGRGKQYEDINRTYESAGTGGGRRHYYYEIDSVAHKLNFYSKNKVYTEDNFSLNYQRPNDEIIILEGEIKSLPVKIKLVRRVKE
ncbi:MAG: hypothetical protein ACRDE7_04145, partial [Sphingobacterium sp.]